MHDHRLLYCRHRRSSQSSPSSGWWALLPILGAMTALLTVVWILSVIWLYLLTLGVLIVVGAYATRSKR